VLRHLQLDLCFILLSHSFSRDHSQLDKGFLLHSIKSSNAPTISILLLLGIRVFRGPRLPKTYVRLIESAMPVVRRVILPISAPNPRTHPLLQSVPTRTHGANSIPVATKQNYAYGRVNHVAVEEAQEALDVVIGIFSINDTSAVVLFDSGASHYFISVAYVGKHNLPLALLKYQMIVSSPGGYMPAS
jgi:hypothetical protein